MASKLSDYAGQGTNQIQDAKVPYLKIAQEGMTAELNKQKPEYIKGLEAGHLFCSTTKKVFGSSMEVVVLATNKSYSFYDRQDWKGSTLVFDPSWERDAATGALKTKEGWKVTTCYNYLVIQPEDLLSGNSEPMVLTLKNTDTASARDWNTKIKQQKFPDGTLLPLFGTVWKLSTMYRENDGGKGWYALGNGKVANVNAMGLLPDKFVDAAAAMFKIASEQHEKVQSLVDNTNGKSVEDDGEY